MAKNTMTKCPACGSEIASSAKACPNCGAKIKKPFFKRPIGIILIAIVVIGIISVAMGGGDDEGGTADTSSGDKKAEKKIEYKAYSVDDMMKELDENAANADEKYRDQYVEISGKLGTIDSEGSYFDVVGKHDDFAILGVTCNIQNDDQLKKIKELKKGADITVKGQITDVGEVIAYEMDVDEIN